MNASIKDMIALQSPKFLSRCDGPERPLEPHAQRGKDKNLELVIQISKYDVETVSKGGHSLFRSYWSALAFRHVLLEIRE